MISLVKLNEVQILHDQDLAHKADFHFPRTNTQRHLKLDYRLTATETWSICGVLEV